MTNPLVTILLSLTIISELAILGSCRYSYLVQYLSDTNDIELQGITILEAPFIYSESGPYRGYSVDVIHEISIKAEFNYSLRQSPDGQIGSVDLMNGVYGELSKKNAAFAIGDISRNWQNDERKANNVGVVFTRPILVSTLSVLLSRSLLRQLGDTKRSKCERLFYTNGMYNRTARSPRCNGDITFNDILSLPGLNRLVIEGSPVHEFFVRYWPQRLPDLDLITKSILPTYGLDRLRNHQYVLIDETKFTEYYADQDCEFVLIDASGRLKDERANVNIDDTAGRPLSIPKFHNEIVIALSSNLIKTHQQLYGHNWLHKFNHAIDQLEQSGKLRQLQDTHWRNHCRRLAATNNAAPVAKRLVDFLGTGLFVFALFSTITSYLFCCNQF